MIRIAVLASSVLLILAAVAFAAEGPDPLEGLLKALGAREWKDREEATKALEALGPDVLPRLRDARTGATDPEVRLRLEAVVARLEAEERRRLAERIEAERGIDLAFLEGDFDPKAAGPVGTWVVVAGGRLAGRGQTLEEAVAAAKDLSAGVRHRFVFRPGVDDALPDGDACHGSLRAGDLGSSIDRGLPLPLVYANGRTCLIRPDGTFVPAPPARFRSPEGGDASREFEVFLNTGFPGQVCLDPDTALALGLARWEIPGILKGATLSPFARGGQPLEYPARRAWVILSLEGVGQAGRVVATLPRAIEEEGRDGEGKGEDR